MAQPHSSRDMSTLVGTSKTLERAISGLLMSSKRLSKLLGEEIEEHPSTAMANLIAALDKLSKDDRVIVDAILSHRGKIKRKHK